MVRRHYTYYMLEHRQCTVTESEAVTVTFDLYNRPTLDSRVLSISLSPPVLPSTAGWVDNVSGPACRVNLVPRPSCLIYFVAHLFSVLVVARMSWRSALQREELAVFFLSNPSATTPTKQNKIKLSVSSAKSVTMTFDA